MKVIYLTKNHLVKSIDYFTSRITFFICLVVIFMVFVSCENSSKNNASSNEHQRGAVLIEADDLSELMEKTIDIPIAVNLVHTEDEFMKSFFPAEYEITHETDNDIYIDINSRYNKHYLSGTRFMADHIASFTNSEDVEYLTLNLDVVNNNNEQLSIQELNIKVDESKPDTTPSIYICTTADVSNSIYFVNESWFNWKGFTFSYSIMKSGDTFDGHYKHHRHIPFFSDYTVVNLLPDMIEMGYDFDGIIESLKKRHTQYNYDSIESVGFVFLYITKDDADFDYYKEKFWPFGLKEYYYDYAGFATLYGSIKFDDSDFKVDFIAEISLSTAAGFGAASYENDKFDIMLKSSGKDYMLRFPYTTVIEPYGAEMIKLSVIADKSSLHRFHIDIKNDNGLKIRSKDIHFHHYFPKN